MKKILILPATLFVIGILAGKAQTEKKKPPPPPPPLVEITKFQPPASAGLTGQKDFLKRNPDVALVKWQEEKTIILKLKSGKEEKYDLTNETEQKNFTGKYGVPPMQPPPPPPPKPVKESGK